MELEVLTVSTAAHASSVVNADMLSDDDRTAEAIANLSAEDADKLWSVIIQLKPHLLD